MREQDDQVLSLSDRCVQFLTNHRKPIAILLGSICAVIAVGLAVSFITLHNAKNASMATEALITEWTDLRAKKADDMESKEDALVEKLETQAGSNGRTYAAFRAYTTLGEIYTLRKEWDKALGFYQKAGESLPKQYTAGIAYFNAAACADELQQYEKALDFYTLSADSEAFSLKPRALFNIGRIEEMLAHSDKAVDAYTKLIEAYPDNEWALLGKSRIIALSIQ